MPALLTACALALTAGACETPDRGADPPAPAASPAELEPPPAPPPGQFDAGADDPVGTAPDFSVALDGEGMRLVQAQSGSTRLLPFGTPAELVLAALTSAWGPWRERAELPDCAADPPTLVSWSNGLTVMIQDDSFVGWNASAPRSASGTPAGTVTTMAGVGIGSTRAEAESAYVVEVRQTSLGSEFTAGDIFGVFADDTPGAEITAMWAGSACIFR